MLQNLDRLTFVILSFEGPDVYSVKTIFLSLTARSLLIPGYAYLLPCPRQPRRPSDHQGVGNIIDVFSSAYCTLPNGFFTTLFFVLFHKFCWTNPLVTSILICAFICRFPAWLFQLVNDQRNGQYNQCAYSHAQEIYKGADL